MIILRPKVLLFIQVKLDKLGTFRIANIGNITYKDMEQFIDLLDLYIKGLQGGEEYFIS